MAIINATPDSFHSPSRHTAAGSVGATAERFISEGADIIDVGAYSSRPGADDVSEQEEMTRLRTALREIRAVDSHIPVSVDTFRSAVARMAVEEFGADIINDISGGDMDEEMFGTVASLHVPYVLMHMRGTPATMQHLTDYADGDVTGGVIAELSAKIRRLHLLGVSDVIIDPGLGFAKTTSQNFTLLRQLPLLTEAFGLPILIGLSRKSMLTRTLSITPAEALEATVAADMIALMQGASILRVHDPLPCRQSVELFTTTFSNT
ncbi:MAG: dihydropteroate synthase [Barnesiella sp.]|nr:dihydropteroate synthase [Barnesiella sp.]